MIMVAIDPSPLSAGLSTSGTEGKSPSSCFDSWTSSS